MEINRKEVTEPLNFVWIPAGHAYGVPTGIVGYWEGNRTDQDAPIVNFPEGEARLGSKYVKMYEPTGPEIDEALEDDARWAERLRKKVLDFDPNDKHKCLKCGRVCDCGFISQETCDRCSRCAEAQ